MLACCTPGFDREGAVPYENGLIIIKTNVFFPSFMEETSGVRLALLFIISHHLLFVIGLCLISKY